MKNLKIESAVPSGLIDSKPALPNIRKGQEARPPSTQQLCSNWSRRMVGMVQQHVNMRIKNVINPSNQQHGTTLDSTETHSVGTKLTSCQTSKCFFFKKFFWVFKFQAISSAPTLGECLPVLLTSPSFFQLLFEFRNSALHGILAFYFSCTRLPGGFGVSSTLRSHGVH